MSEAASEGHGRTSLPAAPDGLQLDLLTAIVRLEQIRDLMAVDPNDSLAGYLLEDRVFTCDLPRLRGHLTPETLAWEATAGQ